jgi:predicted nucleotidyltransferase
VVGRDFIPPQKTTSSHSSFCRCERSARSSPATRFNGFGDTSPQFIRGRAFKNLRYTHAGVIYSVLQAIEIPEEEISKFCQRWGVTELAVFGSALRQDFGAESDIDILVVFGETSRRGLFDLVRMQSELEAMLGREVDLVEKAAVMNSQNYIRRNEILGSVHVIRTHRVHGDLMGW